MRVVFAGTPEFAVPTLLALVAGGHEVVLVVTQPDRPAGRGRRLAPSAVKTAARETGLPVFQGPDVNTPAVVSFLRNVAPDVMVVQAFGQKLSPALLATPRLGCVNVHASLLPAYRGAAPINRAILNGEETTGVTVIRMGERIDAGEVLARKSVPIAPDWTAGDLADVLARMGAEVCLDVLAQLEAGTVTATPQDASKVSRAPSLAKRDGLVPWEKSAREVHNHVRGMTPWPGAFTFLAAGRGGKAVRLTVLGCAVGEETGACGEPGTVLAADAGLTVACGEGSVRIRTVKPSGGRAMPADAFARGHAVGAGTRFTNHE